eukprot:TCONS_00044600-protein
MLDILDNFAIFQCVIQLVKMAIVCLRTSVVVVEVGKDIHVVSVLWGLVAFMVHVTSLMNAIALRDGQVGLVIHASKHLAVFMGHVTYQMSAIATLVGQEKTVIRVCH